MKYVGYILVILAAFLAVFHAGIDPAGDMKVIDTPTLVWIKLSFCGFLAFVGIVLSIIDEF